ncbi:MAG: hypothetical protein GQ570_11445 [Helicobacteraceae bacterium]|nr:hypothetical protein [Helicobacteraceae bacterium]
MRSRDGNRYFSIAIYALIFFYTSLNAREYIISYRLVVADTIVLNEKLNISAAMQACSGTQSSSTILSSTDNKNLIKTIEQNREKFITYLEKIGVQIEHSEETKNFIYSARTIMTLKAQCFTVDFNDGFVKITHIKQE